MTGLNWPVCKEKEVERSLVSRAIFLQAPECRLLLFVFFPLFSMASRNPTYCTGSGSKHAWEVSGNIKMQRRSKGETDRDVYVCVICTCVGPVENKLWGWCIQACLLKKQSNISMGILFFPRLLAPTVLSCNQLVVQCFHFIQSIGWMLSHKGMSRQQCKSNVFQLFKKSAICCFGRCYRRKSVTYIAIFWALILSCFQ